MGDPLERVAIDGTIVTGADRSRIDPAWQPLLDDVIAAVHHRAPDAAVHLFGSVATGQAIEGRSDIDLLVIGLPSSDASEITDRLSHRYAGLCRKVEVGAASPADFVGDHDEAYGNRVFLRHYCVHLAGPTSHVPTHDFLADRRAARGFNGDIGRHLVRWRTSLAAGDDHRELARRVARKSLLAVAALVSVHDETWTTDRARAAARWSEIEPQRADDLATLLSWVDEPPFVDRDVVEGVLDRTIESIAEQFRADIGLWQ